MKYKTSELEGKPLDAAVAIAEVVAVEDISAGLMRWNRPDGVWRGWNPSTDWRDGGPIIERERILIWPTVVFSDPPNPNELDIQTYQWAAYHRNNKGLGGWFDGTGGVDVTSRDGMPGSTPLIAAMRAYVASKLGDEVELP